MSDVQQQGTRTNGSVRGTGAEQAYNRRWLTGVIAVPLAIGLLAAAWMLTVAGDLPDPLASHWGQDGVDGYMSLPGHAAIAVFVGGGSGALLAALGILTRGSSPLMGRLGVGLGLGFGLLLTGLSIAVVAGQIGLADASQAEISAPVIWTAAALAVAAAVAGAWLYRPDEVDRTQSPETTALADAAAAQSSALSVAARNQAANGESMTIAVSMGPAKWPVILGIGALVAASVYFILPVLALLGLPAAALLWMFLQGRVIIAPEGVHVLAGGFFRLMPLKHAEIRSAEVRDIRAMDFGGWGYRLTAGNVGFIMGTGPALVLASGFGQSNVISMPDAETAARACALVNAYRAVGGDSTAGQGQSQPRT